MIGNISIFEQYLRPYQNAISQEDDPDELVKDLLFILRTYSLWEQQLQSLADLHAPLMAILQKSAEIIRNPILVFDMEGNLLGQSNLDKATHFPRFSYIAEHNKMSAHSFADRYVTQNGQVLTDLTDRPQLSCQEDHAEEACLSMYLSVDNERIGFCMIVLLDPQELELDRQLIQFLKHYFLEAEEFTSVVSPVRSNQAILIDLMAGTSVSREAIEKFLKLTNLSPPFQLLEIQSNGIDNHTQRCMLVRDLQLLNVPLFVVDFEKRVVVLTEVSWIQRLLQNISSAISARSSHLSVGVSMAFPHLEFLSTAHHQAVFVIDEAGKKDGVYYCRDFALQYLLRIMANAEMSQDLLHPAVGILRRYDRDNGSELVKTLASYMELGMNQIRTAEALYIHRNTLKYRLARIEELTHIHLSDPEDTLYLLLSLRLSMYFDA